MTSTLKIFLVAGLLAANFASTDANANLPQTGQGVILVPPAAEMQAHDARHYNFKRGLILDFDTTYPAGSIVVVTKTHALYFVIGNGKAARYMIASAKRGFEWSGSNKVSMKVKWPEWRPPTQMRERRPELPAHMAGGPNNPLGARAIYLGSSIYRIHGTNEPSSIGKSASSGCIRMRNEDVSEIYDNVKMGALVIVM